MFNPFIIFRSENDCILPNCQGVLTGVGSAEILGQVDFLGGCIDRCKRILDINHVSMISIYMSMILYPSISMMSIISMTWCFVTHTKLTIWLTVQQRICQCAGPVGIVQQGEEMVQSEGLLGIFIFFATCCATSAMFFTSLYFLKFGCNHSSFCHFIWPMTFTGGDDQSQLGLDLGWWISRESPHGH